MLSQETSSFIIASRPLAVSLLSNEGPCFPSLNCRWTLVTVRPFAGVCSKQLRQDRKGMLKGAEDGKGEKQHDQNVLFFVVNLGLVLCCVFVVVRVGMGVIFVVF